MNLNKIDMKIIYTKNFPPSGYKILYFFGRLYIKEKDKNLVSEVDINHERIHDSQAKELLYIFFYIWYGIEFLIKLALMWNWHSAYRAVSFEQESRKNQRDLDYLLIRSHYTWIIYIFSLNSN